MRHFLLVSDYLTEDGMGLSLAEKNILSTENMEP